MVAGIPRVQSVLYFFMHRILIFCCYSWLCELYTLSEDLTAVWKSWICPVFCSKNMNIHLVLSAFTSRPTFLQRTSKASVGYLLVCMFLPIRVDQELMCPIEFPSLMVYLDQFSALPCCHFFTVFDKCRIYDQYFIYYVRIYRDDPQYVCICMELSDRGMVETSFG
jgi:hypothetical protein